MQAGCYGEESPHMLINNAGYDGLGLNIVVTRTTKRKKVDSKYDSIFMKGVCLSTNGFLRY